MLKKGEKIVFIGDSITDCGRARPIAEGRNSLGNGYVSLINAYIEAFHPSLKIRIFNAGISGNTVRDLKTRWESDLISISPNWASIMIGINDVWRQFDNPARIDLHVPLKEYTETLDELVFKTQSKGIKIILMTPYFIEPNKAEPMRKMMDEYGMAVAKIAKRRKTLFVNTQAAFDKVLKDLHPMVLAWDRVHPGLNGHMIIAKAFLDIFKL